MTDYVKIPEDEQMEALAKGVQCFYQLIKKYAGGPILMDCRSFLTVTKKDLTEYIRKNRFLAADHITQNYSISELHDLPVLLVDGDHWIVCWMDHGKKTNIIRFDDLSEAVANFLLTHFGK